MDEVCHNPPEKHKWHVTYSIDIHARIQRGSNFDNVFFYSFFFFFFFSFFLVDEGGSKYSYKRAIIGPPAKRRWRADDGWLGSFVIFQGSRTSIVKKPNLMSMQGGGVYTPDPPTTHTHTLWIRAWSLGVKASSGIWAKREKRLTLLHLNSKCADQRHCCSLQHAKIQYSN